MIEKLIDDWLTNISERAFETPFAQLLALEGYTIVHMARPHGPMEQGKDMLGFDPQGRPCAFQLKSGDLSLKNWRNSDQPLKGQIEDLLDIPIDHPSFRGKAPHSSALVTTGNLDDTLRQTIEGFNRGRDATGKTRLDVWAKGQIASKIKGLLDRFIVGALPNIRDFLQLALVDGKGVPDCQRVESFLAGRVSRLTAKASIEEVKTCCAELVILSTQLVQPYQVEKNYIGEIQVWTLVCATLLNVACLSEKIKSIAFNSLGLVELSIWQAMTGLIEETLQRERWHEGNVWVDPFVLRARATHVAGFLAVAALWAKKFNEESAAFRAFERFWKKNGAHMWLWGEGAVPSFLTVGWAFDEFGARLESEIIIGGLIHTICRLNGEAARLGSQNPNSPRPVGLADPYVTLSEILSREIGRGEVSMGVTYTGQSYSLEALVKIFARRRMRPALAAAWYEISEIGFQTYQPETSADLWKWSNGHKGFIESKFSPQPMSWKELLREAENPRKDIEPPFGGELSHLLLLFLLTAPHRLNPSTALAIERCNWAGGTWLLNKQSTSPKRTRRQAAP